MCLGSEAGNKCKNKDNMQNLHSTKFGLSAGPSKCECSLLSGWMEKNLINCAWHLKDHSCNFSTFFFLIYNCILCLNSFIVEARVLLCAVSVVLTYQRKVQFIFWPIISVDWMYLWWLNSRTTKFTLFSAGCLEDPTPQRCRAGGGGYNRGPQSGWPGEMAVLCSTAVCVSVTC